MTMSWRRSFGEFHGFLLFSSSSSVGVVKDNDDEQTHALVDYAMRLAFYAGLTAIFLMITALIIKLMWNCDEEEGGGGGEAARESSRLLPSKKKSGRGGGEGSNYGGTGSSPDLETGSNATSSSSSDDELYDGQICVICYDDQRDCFFVPCGHCIACHTCAARIMKEESKSCPICRGIIEKIRKLHIL
ncbi:E3 ubiquitin-protein ligase APD2-like isoform X1 [Andrographis paniculata]|uniref:E3 ubiquitin-protein ligase APD2-like isoform X1 n=1 Tax=Andrographis paniculata TaxID=175694 RepID=UPI0021E7F8BB|nr:E3 ubiquitin-protein ligase APD2-like isoform X1 [Andrographis paniculata]